MFKQLDIVHILTTRGIKYLSGPEGHAAGPNGNWSIVGFVGPDAIVSKDSTLARVPLTDLEKVASYDIDQFLNQLNNTGYSKSNPINIIEHISKELDITILEAQTFLSDFNFKSDVSTKEERDIITERVKILWQRRKNQQ